MRGTVLLRRVAIAAAVLVALFLVARAIVWRGVRPPAPAMALAESRQTLDAGFPNYWSAVAGLDLDAARQLADDPDREELVEALAFALAADTENAVTRLADLVDRAADPKLRGEALEALGHLLIFEQKWAAFLELSSAHPEMVEAGTLDDGDVILAGALADGPAERWSFPDTPVELPTDLIASGSPRIPVVVNGRGERFVIDTGASFTVLTEKVARRCGVEPIGTETGFSLTSTSHRIPWRPARIDRLELGGVTIENHPAAIVSTEALEFGILGILKIKIDGILGWPAFRNAALEIDYGGGSTTVSRSEPDGNDERNLFWLGYPLVQMKSNEGLMLNFGLDTGAGVTSLRAHTLDLIETGPVETAAAFTLGAGGREKVVRKRVRHVTFIAGDQALTFGRLGTSDGVKSAAVWLPHGRLGSDIARDRILRIDYPNGRFELVP